MTGNVRTLRDPRHQPPPADLPAEEAVLSACMLAQHVIDDVRNVITPADFYADCNRRVFETIVQLRETGIAVDAVSVASALRDAGRLDQVGGTPYLATLTDATPAVANVLDHAALVLNKARARRVIDRCLYVEARLRTGESVDDVSPDLTKLAELGATRERSSALQEKWVYLGNAEELLTKEAPAQNWLLKVPRGAHDVGVLPRGRCGLLTATGGVGKTYALVDLAIAVALGDFWLGTFRVVAPGNVLLALAEEDLDEARRRLWKTCNARELSLDQRRAIAMRLHLLPLAGSSVALTYSPMPGVVAATGFAADLREHLDRAVDDWSLLVLDPLSRWAGGGVETDNEAATRFVQVVETLTTVRGRPVVLVAHHSSKASAKDGASDARGVTALRDGFRWQASLDVVRGEDGSHSVKLTNRKSNYSRLFDDVLLVRSENQGTEGTLQPARREAARGDDDSPRARVLDTVRRCSGLRSASAIAQRTRGRRADVIAAVRDLLRDGELAHLDGAFVVPGSGTEEKE